MSRVAPVVFAVRCETGGRYSPAMTDGAPLTFCCLLWSHPATLDALHAYEDAVLALFADHGASVIERARRSGADAVGGESLPAEVQLLRFPDQEAVDAYLSDPRRSAMLPERDRVIARTELFPVRLG